MKRALSHVYLTNAVGFDRDLMAMSTVIASHEWRMEAEFDLGRLGDVHVYRNANANNTEAEPDWQWYGGLPTANIKAYRFAPEAVVSAESQTTNQAQGTLRGANPVGQRQ